MTCGVSNRIGEKVGLLDSGPRVPSSVDIFSTSRSIIIDDISRVDCRRRQVIYSR